MIFRHCRRAQSSRRRLRPARRRRFGAVRARLTTGARNGRRSRDLPGFGPARVKLAPQQEAESLSRESQMDKLATLPVEPAPASAGDRPRPSRAHDVRRPQSRARGAATVRPSGRLLMARMRASDAAGGRQPSRTRSRARRSGIGAFDVARAAERRRSVPPTRFAPRSAAARSSARRGDRRRARAQSSHCCAVSAGLARPTE